MKLKELAEQLGLSQTTVSRALNGYPEVNEATRKRVAEAARHHGYRPNVSARTLATGRVGAIGIVLERIGEVHVAEFLNGVGERLAHDEIDIVVSPLDDAHDEMTVYRRLASSKRVDAVILHSPTPSDPRIKALIDMGMPFILHGRTELDLPYPWLDIDNSGAIHRATSHLLDLGHRHIALINGPPHMTFAIHRERGYRDALADRGIAFDPRLIASGRFTDEIGLRAAQSMLERTPRPTAFLAGSMMTALGVFRAIRAAGLELGRDVSMIAHDDVFQYLNADNMVPSMSTTRSSMRAAGSRVADLLVQILAGKPATDVHELWPVELVLRESSGPPRT